MRILCFGDSNTYGFDPRSCFGDRYPGEDRWVDILAKKTQWEFLNAGINGREVPRNPDALQLFSGYESVDGILVMLGTNDLLQGASASQAAARMEAFLYRLPPDCGRILLIAPPPMKRDAWVPTDELVKASIQLAEEYSTLSQRLGIPFADTRGWNIELAFDGVHFTEKGHRSFANQLLPFLLQEVIS